LEVGIRDYEWNSGLALPFSGDEPLDNLTDDPAQLARSADQAGAAVG